MNIYIENNIENKKGKIELDNQLYESLFFVSFLFFVAVVFFVFVFFEMATTRL